MNEMENGCRCVSEQEADTIKKIWLDKTIPIKPDMLEKDLLVADAIRAVCGVGRDRGAQIIFAGGTCLSQAHQVIQRMSEDADFRIVLPPDAISQGQRRKFLSSLKEELLNTMAETGFPIDGELKARNGNAYMMGNFAYAARFPVSDALRPNIKLEITAFDPISQVEYLPLRTIVDKVLNRPADPDAPRVPVVSIQDTLADKAVGYLRRTAADRAGVGRGAYDDRLVRHIYDTHCILQAKGDLSDIVGPLFIDTVERDRETYGNQFPAFQEDPFSVLREERERVFDSDTKDRYEAFCRSMIYGKIPGFQDAARSFYDFTGDLLAQEPTRWLEPEEGETAGDSGNRPAP